jgi:nucleoside-diphosphate-sugar epimerase
MITVLGHKGFIGSQIVNELQARSLEYYLAGRDEDLSGKNLGQVIYCIGLTADAKRKPFDTIQAHISKLMDVIRFSKYESITYASSSRVYIHGKGQVTESDAVLVDVADPFELFNLTKLTAEALLLNTVDNFKSVRYSNVYGADIHSENFLTTIITEAIDKGAVTLHTTADSAKDYISVYDAARLTVDIALHGKHKIYNVASGINTRNGEITNKIKEILNCGIYYDSNARQVLFPSINIQRIKEEFAFQPSTFLAADIELLVAAYKQELKNHEVKHN